MIPTTIKLPLPLRPISIRLGHVILAGQDLAGARNLVVRRVGFLPGGIHAAVVGLVDGGSRVLPPRPDVVPDQQALP
ncbi:hypothetical protein VTK26DRAFT_1766 [Humicola hyalothermophila]